MLSQQAVPNLKVLLGALSSDWERAIKRLAAADHGLEILGQVKDPLQLLLETQARGADVVVLSQRPDGSEPGICSHLLLELPNVSVVLVPPCADSRPLVRMVLQRQQLPSSDNALYTAIRGGQ